MLIPGNLGMLIEAWISGADCRLLEIGVWISGRLSRGCWSLGIGAWIPGRLLDRCWLAPGKAGCTDFVLLPCHGSCRAAADFSVALTRIWLEMAAPMSCTKRPKMAYFQADLKLESVSHFLPINIII